MSIDPNFSPVASPAEWAKMYRACRMQVVPCYMPGEPKDGSWKRPKLPEWKTLQESLISDAEFERLYGPGGKYAACENMGFVTGPASDNRFVIDLDTHKNPAAGQWWQGLLEVHNNGIEPETWCQRTGGGGRQLVFSAPPDWRAPTNRTRIGVDFRGFAGFAVMPPSLHDSGRHYEWEPGRAPWELEIAEAPEWLPELIESLVETHGGDSGGGGRERTASSGGDFDAFGKHKDGREEYMRDMIWAAVVYWRRQCPMPPSPAESAARMSETWLVYERNTCSRLPPEEGVSNAELLEREGRGHSLFANKWRRAMSQWDTGVAEDAAQPKPGAFRASTGGDATGADAGNERAADEDWDASEDDERIANEAPVAQTLPVIKVRSRISLLTTETQQMLIGAKVPFYQRGGELVRPIIRTVKAAHSRLTKTAQLKTINPVYMRDTMCRHAHWVRFDRKRKEWIETMAPLNVAQTLLARDRGKYIAACLTICRAYVVAGYPGKLPRLVSFDEWSDVVRSALVWLGKADPLDTLEDMRADDPDRELLGEVLRTWAKDHGVGTGSDAPLNVIVDRATKMQSGGGFDPTLEPVYPEFNAAVRAAAGATGNAKVDVMKFGFWCRAHKGRIVDGLRLMNKPSKRGGAATWWVERK